MKTKLILAFLLISGIIFGQGGKTIHLGGSSSTLLSESEVTNIASEVSHDTVAQFKTAVDIGGDHYVAPWGNDANAGTFDAPWATWDKVETDAVAGDTIYIRGGTYIPSQTTGSIISFSNSGTLNNRICVWAYPGERPVLDFSTVVATGTMRGIAINDDYLHLKGLRVTGMVQQGASYPHYGIYLTSGAEHNIIENCEIDHIQGPGLLIYNAADDCSDNLILNCDSHDNGDPLSANPYGLADGFACQLGDGTPATFNTFRGCRAWKNSDDGIDFISYDGIIYIEDCWSFWNGYIPDTWTLSGDGSQGFKLGATASVTDTLRFVDNCLSVGNLYGFHTNSAAASGAYYLRNNTAYGNLTIGFALEDAAHVIKNNLAYGNTDDEDIASPAIESNNSWDASPAVTVSDADFVSVDTMQLLTARNYDGSLPDIDFMKLVPSSDLVEAGIDVGLDYHGFVPDIGAFESGVTNNSSTVGIFNVLDYGAVGDGVTDDASAFSATITAAGVGGTINVPYKSTGYRLNSTITLLNSQKIYFNNNTIKTGITNMTPVIQVAQNHYNWYIQDVFILPYSIPTSQSKFIGVRIGNFDASENAYYGAMRNVIVYYAYRGFSIAGWTMIFEKLQTRYCGIGIYGGSFNNCSFYDLIMEDDSTAFKIQGGGPLYMSNVLLQGSYEWQPSHIDNMSNVTIDNIYCENSTSPAADSSLIVIGQSGLCKNISITGLSNGMYGDAFRSYFHLNKVHNFTLTHTGGGPVWGGHVVTTTSNTYGVKITPGDKTANRYHENNKLFGQRYNYFPNSSLECYLKGWSNIFTTGLTLEQETDTVKSGISALKLRGDGGTYNMAFIYIDNELNSLKGKKVTWSCWMYVPNKAGYENSGSRTLFPAVYFVSYTGAETLSGPYPSYALNNNWNFFTDTLTIGASATNAYFKIYGNQSGTAMSTSKFIIIDDLQVVEGVVSQEDMMTTKFPDAENISATMQAGRMIMFSDAAPTDTDQTFIDGDQVWKKTTASGASPGWICTTPGAGGTAVFTEMPNLK